jgi:hypothetical protein
MRPASSFIALLFNSIGHQLLLRALRTDDVLRVGDESLSHERRLAGRAAEAVVVPVPALERDEAGAADAWKQPRIAQKQKTLMPRNKERNKKARPIENVANNV